MVVRLPCIRNEDQDDELSFMEIRADTDREQKRTLPLKPRLFSIINKGWLGDQL
jgi:hypothetical protein